MDTKRCPSGSVGAILVRGDEYLALYRSSYPPGLAGVAGHIDPGETPEDALRRELEEEMGVTAQGVHEILHEVLQNPCNRGYQEHEWHVFIIDSWEGEPHLLERDKHAWVRWMHKEEIAQYAQRGDMDPAWHNLFARIGVLKGES